jgi:phage shock protein A
MSKNSLERLAAIWRANVHELLDRLEDPEKMVQQLVRDMEDSVNKAVAAVGQAVAEQRRLEKERERNNLKMREWQEKAEHALQGGDEEYARQALAHKAHLAQANAALEPAMVQSVETVARLRVHLDELRDRLQEARGRQKTLVARYRAGRLHGGAEAMAGSQEGALGKVAQIEERVRAHEQDFARFEEKVEAAVAQAELHREMAGHRQEEQKLLEVERKKQVEDELAALKARLHKGG